MTDEPISHERLNDLAARISERAQVGDDGLTIRLDRLSELVGLARRGLAAGGKGCGLDHRAVEDCARRIVAGLVSVPGDDGGFEPDNPNEADEAARELLALVEDVQPGASPGRLDQLESAVREIYRILREDMSSAGWSFAEDHGLGAIDDLVTGLLFGVDQSGKLLEPELPKLPAPELSQANQLIAFLDRAWIAFSNLEMPLRPLERVIEVQANLREAMKIALHLEPKTEGPTE